MIKEKESVEPAFKLDLGDMKAMNQNQNQNQNASVGNLHKNKSEVEEYKPMNRVPSRAKPKREDPYAQHDPFKDDNNDAFLTNGNLGNDDA